ncbi:Beta-lactamase domain protein (fragment) [Candidatus Desulfosporosinus infrequens]|uniref:Beta-lactamase domain protein n=1 Tax=Candidatus Desulfosporosinus infrequens TaxID=2043169 RepID=A0A2U3KTV1_9FIRM
MDNDYSAVLHVKYGSTSFLFTGDAESASENDMIASGEDLQSTVLKVGYHGSKYSTSDAFLNSVSPKYAVISVGENSYGHPSDEVLQRLAQHDVQVMRTDKDGTIVATTDGNSVDFNVTPEPISNPMTGGLAISASPSISNPAQNTIETIKVTETVDGPSPAKDAQVTIIVHYKSKDSTYTGTTGSDGSVSIPFDISRATSGYTVKVDVTATYGGVTLTTTTSFTPQ